MSAPSKVGVVLEYAMIEREKRRTNFMTFDDFARTGQGSSIGRSGRGKDVFGPTVHQQRLYGRNDVDDRGLVPSENGHHGQRRPN